MSGSTTNSDNLFETLSRIEINQLHRSHTRFAALKANRLGVIWSSLTGN
jgi:hypothetical protein